MKMMNIPIKVQLDANTSIICRIVFLGCVLSGISIFGMSTHHQILEISRESLMRSRMPNVTEDEIYSSSCNIPYDDSRCSVQSTNFNHSKRCLTDVEAMAGHILPLVSFVMQVCLTRELFVLTGNYSHIIVNILWLISLFIFIIVAIAVHGSTCYNDYIGLIIYFVGYCLGFYVIYLVMKSGMDRPPNEKTIASKHKKVTTTTNHDSRILTKVTVI